MLRCGTRAVSSGCGSVWGKVPGTRFRPCSGSDTHQVILKTWVWLVKPFIPLSQANVNLVCFPVNSLSDVMQTGFHAACLVHTAWAKSPWLKKVIAYWRDVVVLYQLMDSNPLSRPLPFTLRVYIYIYELCFPHTAAAYITLFAQLCNSVCKTHFWCMVNRVINV